MEDIKDFHYKDQLLMVIGCYNVILHLGKYLGRGMPDLGAIQDFQDLIQEKHLVEIPAVDSLYTWTGVRRNGIVWKRPDRDLCSSYWHDLFSGSGIKILNRSMSDHAPVPLFLEEQLEVCPKSFKFQNMWIGRNDLKDVFSPIDF